MPARTLTEMESFSNCSSSRPCEVVPRVRVSTKDQEEAGFSIPEQLRLLREYADSHGFVIVKEFVDVKNSRPSPAVGEELKELIRKTW